MASQHILRSPLHQHHPHLPHLSQQHHIHAGPISPVNTQPPPTLPQEATGRPLKRSRKNPPKEESLPVQNFDQPQGHVDHIFIAEGNITKKPGGKKAPLSCCECRRLKLKCDRNFPCASCKKRGCAEICPEGVLVSGKGTRFILANTEQLHTKIHDMSERIRQLEEALERCSCWSGASSSSSPHHGHSSSSELEATASPYGRASSPHSNGHGHGREGDGRERDGERERELHPLLGPELLQVKSTMGLYGGAQGAIGPSNPPTANGLSGAGLEKLEAGRRGSVEGAGGVEDDQENQRDERERKMDVDGDVHGEEMFPAAGSMALSPRLGSRKKGGLTGDPEHDALLNEVMRLSQSYPLPESDTVPAEPNLKLREYIRSQLPEREEAEYLWGVAERNALWQYNPHPSATFFPLLLHHVYTAQLSSLSPRRLALLLMILAVGCLVDIDGRMPDSPDAEHYHKMARAALCSEQSVVEGTDTETIMCLFYEIWFLLVWSDGRRAVGWAWGLMGLTAKLAQSIGLHKNSTGSKVIPEELEKRRSLWWELLYLDARLALSLGRPPSLCIRYMDCPRPSYQLDRGIDPSESLHYYQEWKHSCYIQCLAPVLEVTSLAHPNIDYAQVIDLDTKIRDFSFPPPFLRSRSGPGGREGEQGMSRSMSMQKASLAIALEAVLLQLHRSYFTRALSGPEESFNRRHKFAPSVVAVFLSASRMIANVEDLYHREKKLTARILGYWSNAFSAAVALCLLVSRAPFTCLSPAALQELERARMLFKSAREVCPRASQVVPILETMVKKANDIYNRWSDGQEVQTVLQHVVPSDPIAHEIDSLAASNDFDNTYVSPSPPPNVTDPFAHTHRSLAQCIVEVHERARLLYPNRKPCSCASKAKAPVGRGAEEQKECPPSHFWAPPPQLGEKQVGSPVLPELFKWPPAGSEVGGGFGSGQSHGLGQGGRMNGEGSTVIASVTAETFNFEWGALSNNQEQSWMSWF